MAKHPVPKRHKSRTQTRSRYAAYKSKAVKRLVNAANTVECKECGANKLQHHLCEACGTYKGRKVMNVKSDSDKITTIQA